MNHEHLAKEALDEVEAQLQAGDLRTARRALDAARELATAVELERAAVLSERLAERERLDGPSIAYDDALARGDWLAARDQAERATGLAASDESEVWRARAADLAARVNAEWRIGEVELDGTAASGELADCAGLISTMFPAPPPLLTDDGSSLVLVSTFGRWVFVRELEVEPLRLRRICWLRSPAPLDYPTIQVDGNSIHLIACGGEVLQLSLRPFGIARRYSLRPFMLPDRSVAESCVVPPGRYVWAQLKELEEGGIAVIDRDEWRVVRRLHRFHDFEAVPGSEPPRMLATAFDEIPRAGLHDESGKAVPWNASPDLEVKSLAAHPGGEGFLALVASDGSEEDYEVPFGLVELLPGMAPSAPLVVAGSNHEAQVFFAVSREERLAWLLTAVKDGPSLTAFRPASKGLEITWSVGASHDTALARDSRSRRVVAVTPSATGIDVAVLTDSAPAVPETPSLHIGTRRAAAPFTFCRFSTKTEETVELAEDLRRNRRAGRLARWVEVRRRERRGDPAALAELADALLANHEYDLAEPLLGYSLDRHPGQPLLLLCRADLAAGRERWDEVERWIEGIAPAELPWPRSCHLHHLRGLARVHAGDPGGAYAHFAAGAELGPKECDVEWNLDLARALLDPLGTDPEPGASALRRIVRACRLADACFARGDFAAARDALEIPPVHFRLEVQSAARLAEAHLALEPPTPRDLFRKAVALARYVSIDPAEDGLRSEIPGLGWDAVRLAAIRERAEAWLEEFERRELGPSPSPSRAGRVAPGSADESDAFKRKAPTAAPDTPSTHALPPLGHEAIRAFVPGLDAAVRETVRYARQQPGWDETQTLRDDLPDFRPVRTFLREYLDEQVERGVDEENALSDAKLVGQHLGYCVNFELHRRKVFFADASLAWMLGRTNLDIEARTLRLPFPCFAVVFTDRTTLATAEALLQVDGGFLAGQRLQILTVYVKRIPAPDGRRGLSLSMVFDARAGEWPYLLTRDLCIADDDDLETILDSRFPDVEPDAREVFHRPEMRQLVHVVVNAILYATSADVAWPLAPSPVRALRSESRTRGKAKQARLAHRAEELSKTYSSEDVFYLPGRIPISQLRALEHIEREKTGPEILSRFMVRGHWRRANPSWQDQRVRWIEPYWKGPELAAIVEKEYRLKI
jgi:hypothetical protein